MSESDMYGHDMDVLGLMFATQAEGCQDNLDVTWMDAVWMDVEIRGLMFATQAKGKDNLNMTWMDSIWKSEV